MRQRTRAAVAESDAIPSRFYRARFFLTALASSRALPLAPGPRAKIIQISQDRDRLLSVGRKSHLMIRSLLLPCLPLLSVSALKAADGWAAIQVPGAWEESAAPN